MFPLLFLFFSFSFYREREREREREIEGREGEREREGGMESDIYFLIRYRVVLEREREGLCHHVDE